MIKRNGWLESIDSVVVPIVLLVLVCLGVIFAISSVKVVEAAVQRPEVVDGGSPQIQIDGKHHHDWMSTGHNSDHSPAIPGMRRWQEQICSYCGAKRFLEWPLNDCVGHGKFAPGCADAGP
jgi:hypothetical protein